MFVCFYNVSCEYTSRIILQRLGVLDYGIYNLVSTVVMIFLFLNNML